MALVLGFFLVFSEGLKIQQSHFEIAAGAVAVFLLVRQKGRLERL